MDIAPPPPNIIISNKDQDIPQEPIQTDDASATSNGEPTKFLDLTMSDSELELSIACDSWEISANLPDRNPRYTLRSAKTRHVHHKLN